MRLWIDTDPALGVMIDGQPRDIDDAYVLVEALNDPRIDLAGVSVVFGNAPADEGVRVAREILGAKGSTLAVQRGAAAAPEPGVGYPVDDAVRAMAAALREGPLSIVAIGPLTNVASLVENFPEEAADIEQCSIVAGRTLGRRFTIAGRGGIPDFNFESDWRAAELLAKSRVPLTLAGFELTSQVAVTRAHLEAIRDRSAVTRDLVERSIPWLEFWMRSFPIDPGFHPWDSAALAILLRPEHFVSDERGIRVRHVDAAEAGGEATPWLETHADLPGRRVRYCTGFAPGGDEAFLEAMLASIE